MHLSICLQQWFLTGLPPNFSANKEGCHESKKVEIHVHGFTRMLVRYSCLLDIFGMESFSVYKLSVASLQLDFKSIFVNIM